jgi:hypothetical protein
MDGKEDYGHCLPCIIGVFRQTKDSALLFAAPELLACLEAIHDLPADDNGVREITPGFLDDAREAIAKATSSPASPVQPSAVQYSQGVGDSNSKGEA